MEPQTEQAAQTSEKAAAPRLGLGRTVVALGFVSLFTDMSSEMVYTQVPLFLTVLLSAPASVVGLIEGVAESVASLMKLVSGWFSDRSGRRKPLTALGYTFGAVSKPLMALATVWPTVLALRFFDRLGKGLRTAPRDALIAETTPNALRGRAFGLHRSMDTMGAVLGPLLGIWFLTYISSDLRHLFLFAGLPGLLAVLTLLIFVREPKAASSSETPRKTSKPALPRWRDLQPAYRWFLLATLVFNLGNFSDAILILRVQSLGFAPTEILWLYAAFNLVETALGYVAGGLSDKVGRKPLIVAGYLLFACVYLGFALSPGKTAVWGLFLVYGLYYTLTQGAQRAFAADLADPAQRATQIGAYHTVVGVALLPASILAGWLFDRNAAAPFLVGATLAAVGALLLLTLRLPLKTRD